jgi:hypothetical protein
MAKPKPNVYLTATGTLRTYFDESFSAYGVRWSLLKAHDTTAMALTTTRADRELLAKMYEEYEKYTATGVATYIVSPEAAESIYDALLEISEFKAPILPLTPYEKLGAIDDLGKLTAKDNFGKHGLKSKPRLTKGKSYAFTCFARSYQKPFKRDQMHYKQSTGQTYVRTHECQLEGDDSTFRFTDDNGVDWLFREHPEFNTEICEKKVWEYFEEPDIPTLKEAYPEKYDANMQCLDLLEDMCDNEWSYFPGQRDYLARFAMLDRGLCCIETGGGKTLAAFSLFYLKRAKRALFIVPKGTSVAEDGSKVNFDYLPQWQAEANKFAPDAPVYNLFTKEDYYNLLREDGTLPTGIFLTYPSALFNNGGAFENIPKTKTWTGDGGMAGEERFCTKYKIPFEKEYGVRYCTGIGEEREGIFCLASPSLSTISKHQFDMVVVDEAHLMCNLKTNVTSGLLRMQPRYRFAMTATPITNFVYNIFPIMGWLTIDDWRLDRRRSPLWPYGSEELSRFKSAHVSKERDITAEEIADNTGGSRPSPKDSPVISQVPKLLYTLRRTVGFMSKIMINPDMVKCTIKTLKVPMGKQQHELYAHYLERKNIPVENPIARAMTQQTYLRCVTADPATLEYNNVEGKIVESNYNPKTIAVLSKIGEIVSRGEQVVVVGFKNGQIDELRKRLSEADITYSLIRGGVNQSLESANFKAGMTQVMLMNISCAQAFSFGQCSNMIIGSLDWSYGKFAQACGRVYRLDSPKDVEITVVLHENTIEELLYEKVATKEDAATMCVKGEHANPNVKNVTAAELLAQHYNNFKLSSSTKDESECEDQWPELRSTLRGNLAEI